MKKLLDSNIFLIALLVILFCYMISFISTDVVLTDRMYQKHLDDTYEKKYNEYKDLDISLSDFEDELKQFEQTAEDSSYDWETFYIDSIFILVPLLLVVLGFSCSFLVLILFHKKLYIIRYIHLLKASLISFLVFYIPEIISALYFLIFNENYELKNIKDFESYFYFSKIFNKENSPKWLWDITSETGFVYFIFPILFALLIKLIYKDFKTSTLIAYSYLTYLIVLVFYNTVFWYIFDII